MNFNQKKLKVESSLLLFTIIALPLLSLRRNPDILHDAYFFSQGKAILSGLKMHVDIYSPYGPLVPWIFSPLINLFGEHIIIGRLLGLVILFSTCFLMYSILNKKISKITSLRFISLFVCLSPERTELSSSRWFYGGGIWPTSISLSLTLLAIWTITQIFEEEERKYKTINILISSGFLIFLTVARIQGLVTFLLYISILVFSFFYCRKAVRRNLKAALLGLSLSSSALTLYMLESNSFEATFRDIIIRPFFAADSTMSGRWSSWLIALGLSITSSLICISVLGLFIGRLQKQFHTWKLGILLAILGFPIFFFSASYDFPQEFNESLFLWSLKIISGLPSWFTWAIFLLFFSTVFAEVKFSIFQSVGSDANKSLVSKDKRIENISYILFGLTLLPHLFWNYSYVYNIMSVLVCLAFLINVDFVEKQMTRFGARTLIPSAILLFTCVSLVGAAQKETPHIHSTLNGMTDTRLYADEIDETLDFVWSSNLASSSQYYCDYPMYRLIDPESYKVDIGFYLEPPSSRVDYLKRISSRTDKVLVCDESSFFSESDLMNSAWSIARAKLVSEPSLSVQVLQRNGGG